MTYTPAQIRGFAKVCEKEEARARIARLGDAILVAPKSSKKAAAKSQAGLELLLKQLTEFLKE